ncbi:MAG: class C sortase [Coriobacteriia bacterium]|nr:class C sortase [Coriobacteriia bacterium]
MKKVAVSLVMVLVGVSLLVYPSISNFFAEKNGSRAIRGYSEALNSLDDEALQEIWDEAELYNQDLTGSPVHDPFLEGTGIAMPENYRRALNVNGTMGYVEIPKISVYLPIYHGTSSQVLNRGVGHLEGSTLPIGGPTRHTVITGHTGLTHAKMFTDLTEMEVGDMFYIHVLGVILAYQVDQIKIIEPNITDDLKCFTDQDYCTLLTCTPYGVNSHRLLVRGTRVEYVPELRSSIQAVSDTSVDKLVLAAAIGSSAIMLTSIAVTLLMMWQRKRRRQKRRQARLQSGQSGTRVRTVSTRRVSRRA